MDIHRKTHTNLPPITGVMLKSCLSISTPMLFHIGISILLGELFFKNYFISVPNQFAFYR